MKSHMLKSAMLIFVVSILLIGCSGNKTSNSDTNEQTKDGVTTITFWNAYTGPDGEFLIESIERFNETHEDVQVKMDIMPNNTMLEKLAATASAGGSPDIVALGYNEMVKNHSLGILHPASSMFDGTKENIDTSLIPEDIVAATKIDGEYYGVPFNFVSQALYYNKDLFEKAGLDPESPPENWEQLIDYSIKISGIVDGVYGFPIGTKETIENWPVLMWGNGGGVVDTETNEVIINSPETVEAVETFANLVHEHKISPEVNTGLEVANLFKSGKAGFMINGPWEISALEEVGLNYDIAQIPAGPVNDVSAVGPIMFAMTKTAEGKEDAVAEFYNYWLGKENQIQWANDSGYPPVRIDLSDDPGLEGSHIKTFAKSIEKGRPYLLGLEKATEIQTEAVTPALETILLEGTDVQKALDDAAEIIEQLLEQ